MTTVELPESPPPATLYARVARTALPGRSATEDDGPPVLPDTTVALRDLDVALDPVADYAAVCGFRLDSDVPVTFPHVLGFPLSIWLMTEADFPLDTLGTVHVGNRIVAHAPIPIGATVDVSAGTANLRPHRRGWLFDAAVEVHHDGALAWESTSTNLVQGSTPGGEVDTGSRGSDEAGDSGDDAGRPVGTRTAAHVDPADLPLTGRWRVPADIGRRYGAVSGDRNPIHLSAASAKPFGFPRAIAHGMWQKAAAVAHLGRLDQPCTIDVAFRKPLLLPSTVEYVTRREDDGWSFGLRGRDGRPHLAGVVTT